MNENYEANNNYGNLLFACSNIDDQAIAEGEYKTAQFLFRTLGTIKSSCLSAPVLRSSYLLKLRALESAAYSKKSVKYCQFCYQPWSEGCFTLKVLPKKMPGKCVRKIMKKKLRDPSKLSKYEKNILKKVEKNKGNNLVLKCLKCRKQTVRMLIKFSRRKMTSENKLIKTKKKNKCKKKDHFAGLNSQAVMNAALFKEKKLEASNLLNNNEGSATSVTRPKFVRRMPGSFHQKKDLEREAKVKEKNLLDYQRDRKRAQIIESISKAPTAALHNLKDFFRDFKETYQSKIKLEKTRKEKNEELTHILHSQLSIKNGKEVRETNSSLGEKEKKKRKRKKRKQVIN